MGNLKYVGTVTAGLLTVVLIPGGMATSPIVYRGVTEKLDCQWAVIDWSRSDGPWDVLQLGDRVLEWIREKKLGPVVLAGYSAGGVIAMEAAIKDEERRIAGLLLSNTGPCTIGHGDPELPEKILENWFSEEFYIAFLKRCFAFELDDSLKQELIRYAAEVPAEVAYQAAKTLREYDLRPELHRIQCPVTVAHGKLDRTRTLDHVKMLTDGIRQARVCLLEGGHTIMVDDEAGWLEELNHLIDTVKQKEKGGGNYGSKQFFSNFGRSEAVL